MNFANHAFFGEAEGADNERKFMDMLTVIELRGGLENKEKFEAQANIVQQVITATGGRVGPNEWLNMIKTGGIAAKGLKDAYRRYLDVIADEFEEFHASQVTTKDCAGFLRDNFKNTPNTAKKYAALISRLFKFIIGELGLRQDNPIDQLDMSSYKTGRREVLATHA